MSTPLGCSDLSVQEELMTSQRPLCHLSHLWTHHSPPNLAQTTTPGPQLIKANQQPVQQEQPTWLLSDLTDSCDAIKSFPIFSESHTPPRRMEASADRDFEFLGHPTASCHPQHSAQKHTQDPGIEPEHASSLAVQNLLLSMSLDTCRKEYYKNKNKI